MTILVAHDDTSHVHRAPDEHPERPERLAAALRGLARVVDGHPGQVGQASFAPRAASHEELLSAHGERFVEQMLALQGDAPKPEALGDLLAPDTYLVPGSVESARRAAGVGIDVVRAMVRGEASRAAVLVRPPGHHARREHAMGFCLFNNVALMAEAARAAGLDRIAIVDFDVHHGNGTQEIFYDRPDVLYLSTHQYPFYPGTGSPRELGVGEGTGYTVNVPLSAGGDDAIYDGSFERIIAPVLELYKPQMILVSAGFDAALCDPLAEMMLSNDAYRRMMATLTALADRTAQGRIAMVLEGGYDLSSLERSVEAALEGMLGAPPAEPPPVSKLSVEASRELRLTEDVLREHWRL